MAVSAIGEEKEPIDIEESDENESKLRVSTSLKKSEVLSVRYTQY